MKAAALVFGVLFLAAPLGLSQSVFREQFDSYNLGPWAGQGGWTEWSGSVGVSGDIVNNFALTGTKSAVMIGDDGSNPMGDDMVYDFAQLPGGRPGGGILNNGVWAMTLNTYLQSGAVGQGAVIVLNNYPVGGGVDYSTTVVFNNGTGNVSERGGGGVSTRRPIRYDEWVPLTIVVNLDTLRFDVFYAGEITRTGGTWSSDPTRNSIGAFDLYANEPGPTAVSAMNFDDINVERVRGAESSALSMTPNPISGGQTMRIDADAPQLAGAPGVLFATFVSGIPVFKPVLSFTFDVNGHFGLSAPLPAGVPAPLDISFKVFSLGSQGLSESSEMRTYFR